MGCIQSVWNAPSLEIDADCIVLRIAVRERMIQMERSKLSLCHFVDNACTVRTFRFCAHDNWRRLITAMDRLQTGANLTPRCRRARIRQRYDAVEIYLVVCYFVILLVEVKTNSKQQNAQITRIFCVNVSLFLRLELKSKIRKVKE